jgi:hypothetical protein
MRRKHASLAMALLVGAALAGLGCDHLRARDASAEHEEKDQKALTAGGTSTMPTSDRYGADTGQPK